MALFVIYGYQNSGKTHAAWLVYNLLKAAGKELDFDSHPAQKKLTYGEVLQHIKDRYNAPDTTPHISDFRALIEYKGKKVAIFSAGDCVKDKKWVVTSFVDNLDWAKTNNADHIVCCSRYRNNDGSVRRYLLDNYRLSIYKWYYKSRTQILADQLDDAQKVAKEVFDSIANYTSTLQIALQEAYNNNNNIDEVGLIDKMIQYFQNRPQCTTIKTHQHYVTYSNPPIKCEISDILFVAYSRYRPWMKINFLQAKKVNFNNRKEGLVANKTKLKFSIAKNQYDLLKTRPEIDPLQTGLPKDILSKARNSSITSYGLFYNNPTTGYAVNVEFAFEITDLLQPTKKVTKAYFGSIDTLFGCICNVPHCCHCWHDSNLLTSLKTNNFEEALLNYQIGSPVDIDTAIALIKSINALLKQNNQQDSSFAQFVLDMSEYFELSPSQDDNFQESLNLATELFPTRYVVLVDVDHMNENN